MAGKGIATFSCGWNPASQPECNGLSSRRVKNQALEPRISALDPAAAIAAQASHALRTLAWSKTIPRADLLRTRLPSTATGFAVLTGRSKPYGW